MRPESEDELAEMVRAANGPLRVRGGGTRDIGAPVQGEVVETGGLSGVTLYEPGALTLVAKAGTPVAEIEAMLGAEGQRLAFEPMDHRVLLGTEGEPTLGGVASANVSGPRRISVGAPRDFMLGVRFVDGAGRVVSNGGRVMKNVTGYDLVKLMAGSWGTLGVLTEISLKVLPAPETEATLVIPGLVAETAVAAMSRALGSPFEVSGAAHGVAGTCLRVEGFESQVRYRTAQLTELLTGFGAPQVLEAVDSRALWRRIADVEELATDAGDVWRLSVRPSQAPGLVQQMRADQVLLDWGGGLIWARVPEGTDLRARLEGFGGHATLIRAGAETRSRLAVFQPEPAPVAALTAGLRQKFDPRGILNPGILG
ncbi:FAD-binding protein [Mesobacterium pallidum]|uniref:FAD-binding protein n=1 Tax=Mesobacterium pallidum TaxID=2872037 RepID=UPI001EE1BB57|nr:FAD-binding protein [Mesobacterium pallidum]